MTLFLPRRLGIGALLALAMLATRVNHFVPVPDASWAVFFVAGFYLRGLGRWAFPALMALAVAIDAWVIGQAGLSFWDHYCVSVAYWFLVPAYAAMWFGGALLAKQARGLEPRALGWLLVTAFVATNACYLVSNGSFYWLSDSVANATLAGWGKNLGDWYLQYIGYTSLYIAIAAVVHVVATLLAPHLAPASRAAAR
jgi:hypothetical protein